MCFVFPGYLEICVVLLVSFISKSIYLTMRVLMNSPARGLQPYMGLETDAGDEPEGALRSMHA